MWSRNPGRRDSPVLWRTVRHDALNSNTLQNERLGVSKPIARFYTFVGTIGGPVVLPKKGRLAQTFFFYTHEQWSTKNADTPNTKQMPTVLERAGDFSQTTQTNGSPFFIRDPLATGACSPTTGGPGCFAGNVIPANRINPIGLAILNLFPQPNFFDIGVSNPTIQLPGHRRPQGLSAARSDHARSQRDAQRSFSSQVPSLASESSGHNRHLRHRLELEPVQIPIRAERGRHHRQLHTHDVVANCQ